MAWKIEHTDGVAVVTMNSNRVNAQNESFFCDLDQAFDRLDTEFRDSAVVLTASGSAFSAGLDFEEVFALFGSRDAARIQAWFERYRATNLRILTHPRPTVAAVNGHAMAGGLITALDCDYRVVAEGPARFGLNEVPIGIPMPAVYLELIRYAVATPVTARAALFGETFSVSQALGLGFFHEQVPPAELLSRALQRARAVSRDAFAAFAFSKAALQRPTLDRVAALHRELDANVGRVICDEGCQRALAIAYERVKGRPPKW